MLQTYARLEKATVKPGDTPAQPCTITIAVQVDLFPDKAAQLLAMLGRPIQLTLRSLQGHLPTMAPDELPKGEEP